MADTTGATYLSNISYHPNGMWDQITHGNTLLDRQDIQHGMMRPTKLETLDTLGTHRFSTDQIAYDGAGNIKSMGTTRFAYDPVSRLTGAHQGFSDGGWRDTNFSYDPYGNLTGRSGLDQTGSFSESFPVDSASNHLSAEIYNYHGAQETQFGTGSGSVSVQWDDFFEEVSKVRQGGDERSFAYDADGERVIAGDGFDDTRFFLRDLDGKVLSEFELSGTQPVWKKDYIYRGSQMVAVEDADEGLMHFHLDHLGTPRLITNATGGTVATHDYAPFGFEVSNPLADSVTKKFTGHERDGGDNPGTKYDLDYMHARYYSAWQSRFLSVDPAPGNPKNPQSWNRYAYVLGNPVKYVDPSGEVISWSSPEAEAAFWDYWQSLKEDSEDMNALMVLDDSDVVYEITLEEISGGDDGTLRFDGENTVSVVIDPTGKGSLRGRTAHELRHAFQVERHELGFRRGPNGGWGIWRNDMLDEVDAYDAQYRALGQDEKNNTFWTKYRLQGGPQARAEYLLDKRSRYRSFYGRDPRPFEPKMVPVPPGMAGEVYRGPTWFGVLR